MFNQTLWFQLVSFILCGICLIFVFDPDKPGWKIAAKVFAGLLLALAIIILIGTFVQT